MLNSGIVRHYVLDPYRVAKDLRTGVSVTDVRVVLNGDIDVFLVAALHILGRR